MAGKAMDKLYKFDENGNLVEVLAPTQVGFVGWYAGPEPPEGYLYCDGSAIGRKTYSELFEAVGTLYGAGDGAETFNLPDARGIFFRGDGGENNAAMGTRQGDAMRNIDGRFSLRDAYGATSAYTLITNTIPPFRWEVSSNPGTNHTLDGLNPDEFGATDIYYEPSTVVPTAAENRPINLAMKPCIRYV